MSLLATTELVALAWIASIPGLTADVVDLQLPADETTWAENGAIVVPTSVGGSPQSAVPIRRPVCQVECWATNPNSDVLPWGKANQLAEQVVAASFDRVAIARQVTATIGGVSYPPVKVSGAQVLTEPRRVWSDAGDYAGYLFDLLLTWAQAGRVA